MDTRLEGTINSRRALGAWFKAFITTENLMSRLSRSMLSATSSSENRADVGSRASIHWSGGSPRMGERMPPDNRAGGDLLRVLPSTAKTPEDPPVVSSYGRPSPSATVGSAGGADCAAPLDAIVAVSDPVGLVTVVATSV